MINTHRMLVKGELVNTEKVSDEESEEADASSKETKTYNKHYMIMGISLLGILIIILLSFKRRKQKRDET